MKIGRTMPPAAALIEWCDLGRTVAGLCFPSRAIAELEADIRRHFDVKHPFCLSSGTAALTLTLSALRSLRRGTQVVIPAYTCYSVPAAVLAAGLKPVPCDIDPAIYDFDHSRLAEALSPETLCVIVHHLFGVPADVERTRALCRTRGIFVVEDAAQAMGISRAGRPLGTLGDVGIFSLGRGKSITCGSGGIIVTNSDRIARAVARRYREVRECSAFEVLSDFANLLLMAILIRPRLYWIPAALPFLRLGQTIFPRRICIRRLSGMKAGMLRNWQRRLRESNRVRSESAAYFHRRLAVPLPAGPAHPYLRLPILAASCGEKQRLHALSQARGLGLSIAYPAPVSDIPEVRRLVNGNQFPAARTVADRLLTLPTHHWLSERDKRAIADLWQQVRAS